MARNAYDDSYQAIYDARSEVERAQLAYSKGGSVAAVNKANKRLADATQDAWALSAGIVRDKK